MSGKFTASRRGFLAGAAGMAAFAGSSLAAERPHRSAAAAADPSLQAEPFWGEHQGGIVTFPIQHHTFCAAFDIVTEKRQDLVQLFEAWTAAAARMAAGDTAQPLEGGLKLAVPPPVVPAAAGDSPEAAQAGLMSADSGEAIGMSAARLTLTFGFGVGLFVRDGKDRFGLAERRPAALVDMPKFVGDQMIEAHTGGDLSVQACAEDPQVAFHAIRQLARIGEGVVQLRWVQTGFRPSTAERHLLGFSNGKGNPSMTDAKMMDKVVWGGDEAPAWMRGGTYLVVRRIRFALEHWDHMSVEYQQKAIGETKYHGAPGSGAKKFDQIDAPAAENDADEPPSHIETVSPDAMHILRRSYSYNDGLNFVAERWPPWRQGLEYDAGMFFICYQRDPRTGFIPMYDRMAKSDFMLNQFWTHEGSGLFACPRGAKQGEFIGQDLFASL